MAVWPAPVARISDALSMVQSRLVITATPSRTGPAAATQTPSTSAIPASARYCAKTGSRLGKAADRFGAHHLAICKGDAGIGAANIGNDGEGGGHCGTS